MVSLTLVYYDGGCGVVWVFKTILSSLLSLTWQIDNSSKWMLCLIHINGCLSIGNLKGTSCIGLSMLTRGFKAPIHPPTHPKGKDHSNGYDELWERTGLSRHRISRTYNGAAVDLWMGRVRRVLSSFFLHSRLALVWLSESLVSSTQMDQRRHSLSKTSFKGDYQFASFGLLLPYI